MKTVQNLIDELQALTEDQKDLWVLTPVTDCDDGSVRLTETMIRPAFIYGPEEGDDSFLECIHNMKFSTVKTSIK